MSPEIITTPAKMAVQLASHAPRPRLVDGSFSPRHRTPKSAEETICATFPHVHTTTELPSFSPRVWHTRPTAVRPTDARAPTRGKTSREPVAAPARNPIFTDVAESEKKTPERAPAIASRARSDGGPR